MSPARSSTAAVRRLAAALVVVGALVAGVTAASSLGTSYTFPTATPKADCGPGARPETSYQGRVPTADYTSGRVERGYQCNARQVSHHGDTGGFKVLRYRDRGGRTCAFYDSTLLFPKDVLVNSVTGLGTVVLDMDDPARPRRTTTLTSPAMLSPHESLLLNKKRGILAAVLANPRTNAGIVDLYDVRSNCRQPRLLSSTPTGLLGHESGFSPDGRTFWTASAGESLAAIDIADPTAPTTIFTQFGITYHGLRLSDDGRTMYVANIGNSSPSADTRGGLRILDVSQVQDRKTDPQVKVLADLDWRERSIPQVNEPFSRNGHRYLLEIDEYADYSASTVTDPGSSAVGAARIINIDNPRRPVVVSDIRLKVHQPKQRNGDQKLDPGAQAPVQGYAGHYCSVPKRKAPKLVGCSMILSGLRIFDIRDVRHPKEVAYFNRPLPLGGRPTNPEAMGAFAMSQPAWDAGRRSVWYTDGNTGFYVVKLTNGVGRLLD
ncbi:MAG: hypothetical protein ABWX84_05370 [Nocardioides sp.]